MGASGPATADPVEPGLGPSRHPPSRLIRLRPLSDYALAYPPVRFQGPTFHLFLDASHQCLRGNPDPTHAGLYNHCCEDPTLSATVFWTEGHPLPIVRMVTRTTLRRNSQLTYNYDAHIADGAYTISADLAAGQPCTPCRCSPAGCPRNRFFPAS